MKSAGIEEEKQAILNNWACTSRECGNSSKGIANILWRTSENDTIINGIF